MGGFKRGLLVASALLLNLAALQTVQAQEKRQGLVDQLSGQGYGMAGCGLGSILFGEKPGMVQVFASTTNGIYSNNTFGVSSGTSNCTPTGDDSQAAAVFIDSNRLSMQNDVARGGGETLNAFFNVAECQEREAVGQTLQKNYSQIFKPEASNEQVVESIRHTLRQNESTAHSCLHLG
jgi:hypothetical protein